MAKFQRLDISDIDIPDDIITVPSSKRRDQLKLALGNSTKNLLFCVVIPSGKKFKLVDHYDIYQAAVSNNMAKINCAVLSEHDIIHGHGTLAVHPMTNPVTMLRLLKPFVDKYGLEETMEMFCLDTVWTRMYERFPPNNVIKKFESIINLAYSYGAHSLIPLIIFEKLANDNKEESNNLLSGLESMINATKSKFRWPDKAIIHGMVQSTSKESIKKERSISTNIRELECEKCHSEYVITPDYVGPKQEKDGILLLEGDDKSEPHFVPSKYKRYLNITKETPPNIILSKDIIDFKDLKRRVDSKKYMVFVEGNK